MCAEAGLAILVAAAVARGGACPATANGTAGTGKGVRGASPSPANSAGARVLGGSKGGAKAPLASLQCCTLGKLLRHPSRCRDGGESATDHQRVAASQGLRPPPAATHAARSSITRCRYSNRSVRQAASTLFWTTYASAASMTSRGWFVALRHPPRQSLHGKRCSRHIVAVQIISAGDCWSDAQAGDGFLLQ